MQTPQFMKMKFNSEFNFRTRDGKWLNNCCIIRFASHTFSRGVILWKIVETSSDYFKSTWFLCGERKNGISYVTEHTFIVPSLLMVKRNFQLVKLFVENLLKWKIHTFGFYLAAALFTLHFNSQI